ncbi:TPA: bifunctional 3,4-dihydroxy-2-butanone-4-phosphate synthase/GTP cyclohydrolase II [Candidatus Spyradomonas excrementavium]|mgnify:CR=1 FL=1|nr:bifunctional 3,4-dihydroxy-2-butanone-4-phosphate synthase/GTP cyclohydrolase II [Candidatus Spyradomonas excrementavium]
MNLVENIINQFKSNEARFDTIEEAIEAIKKGGMVIVADDESRENEGDLICAAEFAAVENINFMITEAKGIVCTPISPERAEKLGLDSMVKNNTDVKGTAFTQSVDADPKFGVTTGVSAIDRSVTIKLIADDNTKPSDLRQPGHVFPLIAKRGGVLERVGHTEASIDLCRLAGLKDAAVCCEIVNPDGSMARRDDLRKFADKYGIKFITVAQLIAYRLRNERLMKREAEVNLPTKFGVFRLLGYRHVLTGQEHVALVKDDGSDKIPLVRMHSICLTGDTFHSLRCDCNSQLENSMKMINEYGKGAVVYLLNHEGRGIGIVNKIKAYALQDAGADTIDANLKLGFNSDLRDYGDGAQILLDLGYKKFKLITNNPQKIIGLEGYGLEIVDRVSVESEFTKYNQKYLCTKVNRMHHMIELGKMEQKNG